MKEHDPFYGIISEETSEQDYLLGGLAELPKPRFSFEDKKIQYNQKDVHHNSCTVHGAMGAISDLTGYEFTLEKRKDIWNQAIKLGADPSIGWYINKAVKLVSKNCPEDVLYYRVQLDSERFYEVMDLGYTVVVGFRGNSNYSKDKRDGILDGVAFPKSTYGHCVRMAKKDDHYEIIIDNYDYSDSNVYKIKKENLDDLIKNKVFFKSAYFYTLKKDSDMINDTPVWAREAVKWAKENKISNCERLQEPISRVETIVMMHRLTQKQKS